MHKVRSSTRLEDTDNLLPYIYITYSRVSVNDVVLCVHISIDFRVIIAVGYSHKFYITIHVSYFI